MSSIYVVLEGNKDHVYQDYYSYESYEEALNDIKKKYKQRLEELHSAIYGDEIDKDFLECCLQILNVPENKETNKTKISVEGRTVIVYKLTTD